MKTNLNDKQKKGFGRSLWKTVRQDVQHVCVMKILLTANVVILKLETQQITKAKKSRPFIPFIVSKRSWLGLGKHTHSNLLRQTSAFF